LQEVDQRVQEHARVKEKRIQGVSCPISVKVTGKTKLPMRE
jgi:hypothetical protein